MLRLSAFFFASLRLCVSLLFLGCQVAASDEPQIVKNSIGMQFVRVPAGRFLLGSPDGDESADDDERPHKWVRLTQDFYLGMYEVTQEEFQRVMGENPSWFSPTGGGRDLVRGLDTRRFPVENVSWDEAESFCRKLRDLSRQPRAFYWLPTEAQWEYACRAGSTTRYAWGDEPDAKRANIRTSSEPRTQPVGSYPPNAWGLYDMHGNVWEWCADRYAAETYRYLGRHHLSKYGNDAVDPLGITEGTGRVVRGGDYRFNASQARSANRDFTRQTRRDLGNGFRVVMQVHE